MSLIGEDEGNRLRFILPLFPQLLNSQSLVARKLEGGLNHSVFAIETNSHAYCLKLFTDDRREQAVREWWALQALEGSELAPKPIAYHPSDADTPFGAILMEYVEGCLLSSFPQPENFVVSHLLPALANLRQIELDLGSIPWAANGHPVDGVSTWVLNTISVFNMARAKVHWSFGELEDKWLDTLVRDLPPVAEKFQPMQLSLSFCRGDPSLNNVVISEDRSICLLDWEYCGYGDAAYEFADYMHHPSSESIAPKVWLEAAGTYGEAIKDRDFIRRLNAYDLLMDWWWCLRIARGILDVAGGSKHHAEKADLLASSGGRLKVRIEKVVSRLMTYKSNQL